jgi:hypothetical protein
MQLIETLTNWDESTHVYKTRLQTNPRHSIRHTSTTNKPYCVFCNSSTEGQSPMKTPSTKPYVERGPQPPAPIAHIPSPGLASVIVSNLTTVTQDQSRACRNRYQHRHHQTALPCTIGYTWLWPSCHTSEYHPACHTGVHVSSAETTSTTPLITTPLTRITAYGLHPVSRHAIQAQAWR